MKRARRQHRRGLEAGTALSGRGRRGGPVGRLAGPRGPWPPRRGGYGSPEGRGLAAPGPLKLPATLVPSANLLGGWMSCQRNFVASLAVSNTRVFLNSAL